MDLKGGMDWERRYNKKNNWVWIKETGLREGKNHHRHHCLHVSKSKSGRIIKERDTKDGLSIGMGRGWRKVQESFPQKYRTNIRSETFIEKRKSHFHRQEMRGRGKEGTDSCQTAKGDTLQVLFHLVFSCLPGWVLVDTTGGWEKWEESELQRDGDRAQAD